MNLSLTRDAADLVYMEECLFKHEEAQPHCTASDGHMGDAFEFKAVQKCNIHDPPSAAR